MTAQQVEYLVIGGGPGGTPTAMALASAGKSVMLVEKGPGLGGTCLFEGCIPSKIFRESVRRLRELRESKEFGLSLPTPEVTVNWSTVLERKRTILKRRAEAALQNTQQLPTLTTQFGQCRLLSPRTAIIDQKDGTRQEVQFDKAILSTGSVPFTPPISGIDHPRVPDIVLDKETLEKVRNGLIKALAEGEPLKMSEIIGSPYNTDPKSQVIATAYGWGGLPLADASYFPIDRNETKIEIGKALPSSITFTPPKVDLKRGGFWSITTYNKEGWLAKDKAAISNTEATPNKDGSYTIRFNSPGKPNNVDTPAPFSALFRIYVPESKQEVVRFLEKAKDELVIK